MKPGNHAVSSGKVKVHYSAYINHVNRNNACLVDKRLKLRQWLNIQMREIKRHSTHTNTDANLMGSEKDK